VYLEDGTVSSFQRDGRYIFIAVNRIRNQKAQESVMAGASKENAEDYICVTFRDMHSHKSDLICVPLRYFAILCVPLRSFALLCAPLRSQI